MAAPGTPGLFPALPERRSERAAAPVGQPGTQFPHRWLGICLPQLPLEALGGKPVEIPRVIVDGEDRQRTVRAVNAAAWRDGVRRGQDLNAAQALCPSLRAEPRDLRRENARLEELAAWAQRFTPWVSVEPPASLLLEVRTSLHLFGGAQGLCREAGAALDERGHRHRLALAPTPTAALWLSRTRRTVVLPDPEQLPGTLGRLPLAFLGWPDKTVSALNGMGVYTVRDCLRLPRDGFARRFGRRYLAELDRALGRLPDPRPSFSPPASFEKNLDLPAETDDIAQLLIATERLLESLSAYLVARQAGVRRITLKFFHGDAPATAVQVGLVEYCQDAGRLLALARLKLERVVLPVPAIAVQLSSGSVTTLDSPARDLFGPTGGDTTTLLENLRTRLGVTAVYGVDGVAEHRPESAWRQVEPLAETGTACDRPAERPLWLLGQPQPLPVRDDRPQYDGRLVVERGPERIETGWWDGGDIVRDYYVARDRRGLRLWIYRERRPPHGWYLHGYFD